MTPFTVLRAVAAGLPVANIDTDMILPGRFLKTVTRAGLGRGLFAAWRSDPLFVLNREGFADTSVLIAGENFGCGSSREHAPWALLDFGIRCVVAPSFADIFYSNSVNCGLLPAIVDRLENEALLRLTADRPYRTTVDLITRTITLEGRPPLGFAIADLPRRRLLEGRDIIADTLLREDDIAAFEADRERRGSGER